MQGLTEHEKIRRIEMLSVKSKSKLNAQEAIEIGITSGLITSKTDNKIHKKWQYTSEIRNACSEDFIQLNEWNQRLNPSSTSVVSEQIENKTLPTNSTKDLNTVQSLRNAIGQQQDTSNSFNTDPGRKISIVHEDNFPRQVSRLNSLQRIIYDIVDRHLEDHLNGNTEEQLLLNIQGEPGTGKSEVIKAITENFENRNITDLLCRSAYTGIAASTIGGQTLHSLAKIPRNGSNLSRHALLEVGERMQKVKYLIIDEISMVPKHIFAKIERIFSSAIDIISSEVKSTKGKLFGGINVIIVGDFHQFPPVAQARQALYMPYREKEKYDESVGHQLYEQFEKTIILREQMRTGDTEWLDLLQHARYGKCEEKHIRMLRSLIINEHTDLSRPEWQKAVLITPRHSVRRRWNDMALNTHCKRTGHKRFIIIASDCVKGRKLSFEERMADINSRTSDDVHGNENKDSSFERAELPTIFECAIGMEVTITTNLDTLNGLVNGARGTITNILLDPQEEIDVNKDTIELQNIPVCVFVKIHTGTKIA